MEQKDEYELVVSEGRRAIWQILLAGLFFTFMCYCIYGMALMYYYYGICAYTTNKLPKFVELIGYSLSGGISFSVVKTVLIDVDKNILISRFFVGPFSRDIKSEVPELNYVSVFMDAREYYQVNLWYKGNRHYRMYVFDEKMPALQFAAYVAIKLNINLFDATEKGNFHQIDKLSIKKGT